MTIARPIVLWLLVLAPLDLAVSLSRARRLRVTFEALVGPERRKTAGEAYARASIVGTLCSAACVCALVVALAGPSWGDLARAVERSGLEVAIVLDVSRSMEAHEGSLSRLEEARAFARTLIRGNPGAAFSLVAAKGEAVLLAPMTEDAEALELALSYANPDATTAPGTDLGKGLEAAIESFPSSSARGRALVLLSDGGDRGGGALKAAAAAKAKGARLFAVGFGTAEARLVPGPNGAPLLDARGEAVRSALEPELLRALARAAGGRYLEAGSGGAESALAAELAALAKDGKRIEYEARDRTGEVALVALVLLAARLIAAWRAFAGARGGRTGAARPRVRRAPL